MDRRAAKRKHRKDSDRKDEIIDEIPVFVSNSIEENLCIFQYPTKSASFIENEMFINNCKVKPSSKEVKFDVGLDTESIHYDVHKADKFVRAASDAKNEKSVPKGTLLDSMTYIGSPINVDINKFVVCYYQDKEIHMCPLSSIVQIRTTLAHFDKEDKKRKAEEKQQSGEVEKDEAKAVTVKFANAQDKLRTKLHFMKKKSDDEQWIDANWRSIDSIEAGIEKQKLFTTNQALCSMIAESPINYSNKILPSDGGLQGVEALLPPREYSKQRTKSLPLVEQIKIILKDAKILTFSTILKWVIQINEESVDKEKVLRTLGQVGLLFHGNWVPKSEVLYPNDTVSTFNGINADLMIRARDYVLFKLTRQPYLSRPLVLRTTQLPPEETLEILQSCAKLVKDKWVPALPKDEEFEEQHKELVQRQEMCWTTLKHFFQELENETRKKRSRQRSQRAD